MLPKYQGPLKLFPPANRGVNKTPVPIFHREAVYRFGVAFCFFFPQKRKEKIFFKYIHKLNHSGARFSGQLLYYNCSWVRKMNYKELINMYYWVTGQPLFNNFYFLHYPRALIRKAGTCFKNFLIPGGRMAPLLSVKWSTIILLPPAGRLPAGSGWRKIPGDPSREGGFKNL